MTPSRSPSPDLAREPDAVRAAIALTGQFSAPDDLLTGEESLRLMADLTTSASREGRRRAAELLRCLLTGAIGSSAVLAVAWCAVLSLVGHLWALARYDRRPAR